MPNLRPLFAIRGDMLQLMQILDDQPDEVAGHEAVAEQVKEWMKTLGEEEGDKLDSYINYMKVLEMEEAAANAEAEQYAKKANSRRMRREWLKKILFDHIKTFGTRVTPVGRTLSIRKNGGAVPVEYQPDLLATLPESELAWMENSGLVVMQPMIDKDACRKFLLEGGVIPFAKFGEVGSHLRIT